MATATKTGDAPLAAAIETLFTNLLVGVDSSPESVEAVRQAAVLAGDDATLTLLAAWTTPQPVIGVVGYAVALAPDEAAQRAAAREALEAAKAVAPGAAARMGRGLAWEQLLAQSREAAATLVAVGSHGTGRAHGILIGSTATEIVHKAPCSVLVARKAGPGFPTRIVVGIDGSPESAAAHAVAVRLADRFGAELWPVVAHGGKGVDRSRVAAIVDYHHEDLPDEPVRALVAASTEADLLVVGSRGLHGLKAIGSVSERVAHEAHCSTLIVRGLEP